MLKLLHLPRHGTVVPCLLFLQHDTDYPGWHIAVQALTRGGPMLQEFLKEHPDMRAAIPVVLQLLQNMKKT